MAHIGKEFRFRAIGRFGACLLGVIFVGKFRQALRLLFGKLPLFLQVTHRDHQVALREKQMLLLLLERRDVGAHRNKAAIHGAPLIDVKPAAIGKLNFHGTSPRGIISLTRHKLPNQWFLGGFSHDLVRSARLANCCGQGMELLIFGIAQNQL